MDLKVQDSKRNHANNCFHHFRYLVVVFGGLSVGMMFFLRYNVTISVLKMVNQTYLYLEENPNNTVADMIAEGFIEGGEFNWNNEVQQMIMSWYMIAYTLPQLPMAKVGLMLGCRWAAPLSLLVCAISTILTPTFAYFGWQYVIFLRLVNGFGASAILPMLLSLLENWLTYDEISFGLSVSQTISTLCMATNPLIAGYLSDIHWSLSFLVPGFGAIILSFLWLIFITDKPESNFFISKQELTHILCRDSNDDKIMDKNVDKELADRDDMLEYKANSWIDIFKVPSFYAFMVIWSLHNCSFVLPTYLIQILKIKVTENGLFCSIIQSGSILAVMWPHPLLRFLQEKHKLSSIASRRVVMTICCGMLALTWGYVGFQHDHQLILLFLNRCTQNSIDVIVTSTLMLNYAHAGLSSLAYSAINSVGNLSVVFSSTFIGWLLDYTGRGIKGWSMIFNGFAFVQIVLLLLFFLTITADPIRFSKKRDQPSGC